MSIFANTKCLVTGAAGMLGGNFVQRLIKEKARVYATFNNTTPKEYDGDWKPYATLKVDLEKEDHLNFICHGMDYIFHCAGRSYGAGSQVENALNLIGPNIKMNYNILAAAHKAQPKAFIYLSSMTGYPAYDHPVQEHEFYLEDPADVYHGIGWVKRYSEKMCEFFAKHIKDPIKCIVPRPSNIVGPRDEFNPKKSHIMPALIKKVVDGDDPIEIWGDGTTTRDFLHVNDFIDAVFLMVDNIEDFQPLNIAYGKSIDSHQIVEIAKTLCQSNSRIVLNESKPTTIKSRYVNTDLAYNLLGWSPNISHVGMISDIIDWYKKYYVPF